MDSDNLMEMLIKAVHKVISFIQGISTIDLPIFKELYRVILNFIKDLLEKNK